jgi:hypothetical protein
MRQKNVDRLTTWSFSHMPARSLELNERFTRAGVLVPSLGFSYLTTFIVAFFHTLMTTLQKLFTHFITFWDRGIFPSQTAMQFKNMPTHRMFVVNQSFTFEWSTGTIRTKFPTVMAAVMLSLAIFRALIFCMPIQVIGRWHEPVTEHGTRMSTASPYAANGFASAIGTLVKVADVFQYDCLRMTWTLKLQFVD